MASTSITTSGGVVVVTQVFPKDQTSIPLQTTAATATQAPPPVTQTPPTTPQTKKDDMTTTFLKGEPQGLGIVQIFVGLMGVLFSLTAVYSNILLVHAPLCVAVVFVFSGSLALAARRAPSLRLVWAVLVWNVVSVVLSLGGVAYLCWMLTDSHPAQHLCEEKIRRTSKMFRECSADIWRLDVTLLGLRCVLLVLLTLQVCVAVTVSVYSMKAVRRHRRYILDDRWNRYAPVKVAVDDGSNLASGAAEEFGSDVSLLDCKGEETSKRPNCP